MPNKRGGVVFHWKHGFIPLDHYAALQKAHGSQIGAARIMQRHGIADGPKSLHSVDRSNGGKGRPDAPKAVSKDHNLAALEVRKGSNDKGFVVTHKPSGLHLGHTFATKGAAEAARQEHASTPHDLNVPADQLHPDANKHLGDVTAKHRQTEQQRGQQASQVVAAKRNRPAGPKVSNPAKPGDLVVVSSEHADYSGGKGRTVTEQHTPGVVTHVHSDGTPIAYKDAHGRFATVNPREKTRVMSQDQIDVHGVLGHVKATNKWSGGQEKSHFDNLDAIQSAAKSFRKGKADAPAAKPKAAGPKRFAPEELSSQVKAMGIGGGATHVVRDNNHPNANVAHKPDGSLAYFKSKSEADKFARAQNDAHAAGQVPSYEDAHKAKMAAIDAKNAAAARQSLQASADMHLRKPSTPARAFTPPSEHRKQVAGEPSVAVKAGAVTDGSATVGKVEQYRAGSWHATAASGEGHPLVFKTRAEAVGALVLWHRANPSMTKNSADAKPTQAAKPVPAGFKSSGFASDFGPLKPGVRGGGEGLPESTAGFPASSLPKRKGTRAEQLRAALAASKQREAQGNLMHSADRKVVEARIAATPAKTPTLDPGAYTRMSAADLRERIAKGDPKAALEISRRKRNRASKRA